MLDYTVWGIRHVTDVYVITGGRGYAADRSIGRIGANAPRRVGCAVNLFITASQSKIQLFWKENIFHDSRNRTKGLINIGKNICIKNVIIFSEVFYQN